MAQLNPKTEAELNNLNMLNSNKYNINAKNLTYPTNAGTDSFPHYIGFFINIRGKSNFKEGNKTVEISYANENRFDRKKLQQNVGGISAAVGAVLSANVGMSIAGNIIGNSNPVSGAGKVIGLAAGAIVGGTVGALVVDQAAGYFEFDRSYRLDSVIMLAINERPSVQYQVEYRTQDMGSLAGIIAGGTSAIDSGFKDAANEIGRAALLNLAAIPGGIAAAFGSDFDYKALSSLGTGTALNPFREQVFQNVQTRTFQFDYKFLPRSKEESIAVHEIIRHFKFHMHPELSAGGLFYIYPSEFNIAYYYKDKENSFINKISTCVLQNMNVDYGGNSFGSFSDGSPSEINMRLQFVELEVLTKERLDKGNY